MAQPPARSRPQIFREERAPAAADPWDTVYAVIAWGLDTCRTEADIDRFFDENRRTVNEMGQARPDLWQRLGMAVKARRLTVRDPPARQGG